MASIILTLVSLSLLSYVTPFGFAENDFENESTKDLKLLFTQKRPIVENQSLIRLQTVLNLAKAWSHCHDSCTAKTLAFTQNVAWLAFLLFLPARMGRGWKMEFSSNHFLKATVNT